jgi:hypothetical protein
VTRPGDRQERATRIARPSTAGRLLVLTLGVGGATESAGAQQGLLGPGAAYVVAGVSAIATGELDSRLAARGYPVFGRTAASVGLGAYRVLASRVMLGGEWHGLIMGEQPHEGRVVGLGGGYATLGVGYAVELSPRARIYPRLGLGAGGLALWSESAADTVDFDEALADPRPVPGRQPVLSRDGLVIDVGAGAELLPGGRGRGPLIGLRLGYLAARFGSGANWQLYERTAKAGPAATIAGPYVRVVVGGAWRR